MDRENIKSIKNIISIIKSKNRVKCGKSLVHVGPIDIP